MQGPKPATRRIPEIAVLVPVSPPESAGDAAASEHPQTKIDANNATETAPDGNKTKNKNKDKGKKTKKSKKRGRKSDSSEQLIARLNLPPRPLHADSGHPKTKYFIEHTARKFDERVPGGALPPIVPVPVREGSFKWSDLEAGFRAAAAESEEETEDEDEAAPAPPSCSRFFPLSVMAVPLVGSDEAAQLWEEYAESDVVEAVRPPGPCPVDWNLKSASIFFPETGWEPALRAQLPRTYEEGPPAYLKLPSQQRILPSSSSERVSGTNPKPPRKRARVASSRSAPQKNSSQRVAGRNRKTADQLFLPADRVIHIEAETLQELEKDFGSDTVTFSLPNYAKFLLGRIESNAPDFRPEALTLAAAENARYQFGKEKLLESRALVSQAGQKRAFWVHLRSTWEKNGENFPAFPTLKFRAINLFRLCEFFAQLHGDDLIKAFEQLPTSSDQARLEWDQAVELTDAWKSWSTMEDHQPRQRPKKLQFVLNKLKVELKGAWAAAQRVSSLDEAEGLFPNSRVTDQLITVRCVCGHFHYEADEAVSGKRKLSCCGLEQCRTCSMMPGGNQARIQCAICGYVQHLNCLIEEGVIAVEQSLAILGGSCEDFRGIVKSPDWACEVCNESFRKPGSIDWSRRGLDFEPHPDWVVERRHRESRRCTDYWAFKPSDVCEGRNSRLAVRSLSSMPSIDAARNE